MHGYYSLEVEVSCNVACRGSGKDRQVKAAKTVCPVWDLPVNRWESAQPSSGVDWLWDQFIKLRLWADLPFCGLLELMQWLFFVSYTQCKMYVHIFNSHSTLWLKRALINTWYPRFVWYSSMCLLPSLNGLWKMRIGSLKIQEEQVMMGHMRHIIWNHLHSDVIPPFSSKSTTPSIRSNTWFAQGLPVYASKLTKKLNDLYCLRSILIYTVLRHTLLILFSTQAVIKMHLMHLY